MQWHACCAAADGLVQCDASAHAMHEPHAPHLADPHSHPAGQRHGDQGGRGAGQG